MLLCGTGLSGVEDVVSGHPHLLSLCCNNICVLLPSDFPPRPVLVGVLWASVLSSLFFAEAV